MWDSYFLTDSDGRQIENPRYYRRSIGRIRYLQRSLSRKQKGSSNRRNFIIRLNRAYEHLTNQRNDFLHKLSTFYVRNYRAIAVEDLRIPRMIHRHDSRARSILDASWGRFLQMLSYKAERAGRRVVRVNPARTSQENQQIEDRDYRASLNILNRGLSGLGRPSVPVETRPLPAKLTVTPASRVVEAGSPYPSGQGSSRVLSARSAAGIT
jgi:putative transposase